MTEVIIKSSEQFDKLLRYWSRSCERFGVISDLKKRQRFEKPSEIRKKQKITARKRLQRELQMAVKKRLY